MDAIEQVLKGWETTGIIVLLLLAGVTLYYYGSRVWRDQHISVNVLLGITLSLVGATIYFVSRKGYLPMNRHTLLFILLYVWCGAWMLFFAGRTHPAKLALALIVQAIIVYELYLHT